MEKESLDTAEIDAIIFGHTEQASAAVKETARSAEADTTDDGGTPVEKKQPKDKGDKERGVNGRLGYIVDL